MRTSVRKVDVALLGGGPAGCAAALALARHGFSIALIERSSYDNVRVGETLPPEVRVLLQSLGVWDQFVRHVPRASPGIRYVWGKKDVHDSSSIFSPYGTWWHIDRACFDAMLARTAENSGTYVFTGATRTSCSESNSGDWKICAELAGEQFNVRAKLLVDATGRASMLARKRGARRIFYDHLVGVVVFLSAQEGSPLGDSTFVEAVEDGWWYSALLPNSRAVVAYMTDADLNARGHNRPLEYWQSQLSKTIHTKALINRCALDSGPHIFAADSSKLNTPLGKNWLAAGDAAMAFDPLSSQGVYKALESGIRAARAIREHLEGDTGALRSCAREMDESFDQYQVMRNKYYSMERRWPRSTFWRRRRSG